MKYLIIATLLLFLSIGIMAQTGTLTGTLLDTAITNKWTSSGTSASLYVDFPKYPDTVKAGLMIANKRMTGRPRICIGTVIKYPDYTYTFFDHRMNLIDKKRILWAYEIPKDKKQ